MGPHRRRRHHDHAARAGLLLRRAALPGAWPDRRRVERMTLLITGGASGIGAATARLAAERGHKIAINYRSRDTQAQKVVADIKARGGEAVALPADVSRETDIVGLFDAAEKALGPITHVVNSAGIGLNSSVKDFDAAALERLFAVNTVGLILCCREAA